MHQDSPFYPHRAKGFVDVLVHLDDTNEENGEIRFLAGSHKEGALEHLTAEGRLLLPAARRLSPDRHGCRCRPGKAMSWPSTCGRSTGPTSTGPRRPRRLVRIGFRDPQNPQVAGQSFQRPNLLLKGYRDRAEGSGTVAEQLTAVLNHRCGPDHIQGAFPMILQELSRDAIAMHAPRGTAILPTASIEQHGPHLPVGVDTLLCSEVVHRAVAKAEERLGPNTLFVAPVFSWGNSHHHRPFAGVLSLESDQYIGAVHQVLEGLLLAGFPRLLIVNGHGGQHGAQPDRCPGLRASAREAGRDRGGGLLGHRAAGVDGCRA